MQKNYILIIIAILSITACGLATYLLFSNNTSSQPSSEDLSKLEAVYEEQFASSQIDVRGTKFGVNGFDAERLQTISPEAGALLVENTTGSTLTLRLSGIPSGYTGDMSIAPIPPGEVGVVNFPVPGFYKVEDADDPTKSVMVNFTLSEEPARQ